MPRADFTSRALVPLASSASVVSICRTSRLADSAGVDSDPLAQVDPLTETSWHSSADVDPLKSSALSAVLALQGGGVGDEPQLSEPTSFATASLQMVSHWDPVSDVVITLEVVSRPPDAVMSWLTVT